MKQARRPSSVAYNIQTIASKVEVDDMKECYVVIGHTGRRNNVDEKIHLRNLPPRTSPTHHTRIVDCGPLATTQVCIHACT